MPFSRSRNRRAVQCRPSHPEHPPSDRPQRARAIAGVVLVALCLCGLLTIPVGSTASAAGRAATDRATAHTAAHVSAYWLVAADGGIFSFGGAGFYGSTGGMRLNEPVVGMAGTADSLGYWLVASDGGLFAFGDAQFHGSMGATHLNEPVVGMAATPDGKGYWLVASDGGIFAFGDAQFHGSMGGTHLNEPVVGMAATPDGKGYWLVAADGGIFAFGDAQFHGSTGNITLNQPIVGMTAAPNGHGYWFTAADGGVFAFDAPFLGSLGNVPQSHPIVSITADADGQGYWFTNSNGAVSAFGDATYWGSSPQVLNEPVVGMAEATGNGSFTGSSYPSGSFGYDISWVQCPSQGGMLPPAPHTIGIVQVEEPGYLNPCLAQEAQWAGAGLNLYVYLNYGNAGSSGDPACNTADDPSTCNYGFEVAQKAFADAQAAGVNTSVAWWLDVETATSPGWSQSTVSNADLIQGAIQGLQSEGLNSVGIYASPAVWPTIAGGYQPKVPYWAADWAVDPGTTCTSVTSQFPGLPTGPVQIVQYSSPSSAFPLGGMSTLFDDDYAC